MSRTCHSVIYTFVCAGGRDRSPFPFYSSLKPVRSYRVPIPKGAVGAHGPFSPGGIKRGEKRRERKKNGGGEEGKREKATMSYEARCSRTKLAKVTGSGKIGRSVVAPRSQVCGAGCSSSACLVNLFDRDLFSKLCTA